MPSKVFIALSASFSDLNLINPKTPLLPFLNLRDTYESITSPHLRKMFLSQALFMVHGRLSTKTVKDFCRSTHIKRGQSSTARLVAHSSEQDTTMPQPKNPNTQLATPTCQNHKRKCLPTPADCQDAGQEPPYTAGVAGH